MEVSARSCVVTSPIAPRLSRLRSTPDAPTSRSCELVPWNSSSSRKSNGVAPPSEVGKGADARDLRVEPRAALLQRILNTQRGADPERRKAKRGRTDRRAGLRQHGVDADGSKQGALAGHVRAADDEQLMRFVQLHVVPHAARGRQQRMTKAGAVEQGRRGRARHDRGERVRGMLECERRERRESLELGDRVEPAANVPAVPHAPRLDGPCHVRSPQERQRDDQEDQVVLPVVQLHQPMQRADGDGGSTVAAVDRVAQGAKPRGRELLLFQTFEQMAEDVEIARDGGRAMKRPFDTALLRPREPHLERENDLQRPFGAASQPYGSGDDDRCRQRRRRSIGPTVA